MRTKLAIIMLAAALALVVVAPAALAQCSQCREAAAASADGGRSMNFAILVLLVPTLLMFVGLLVFALSRRDALLARDATPVRPGEQPSLPLS